MFVPLEENIVKYLGNGSVINATVRTSREKGHINQKISSFHHIIQNYKAENKLMYIAYCVNLKLLN